MNPQISIILPVYNVEAYLCECFESVLSQSYGDFELIVIDDGSQDRSGEICDEYARRDGRITVVHQQNAGLSASRNKGIDMARGKYIAFVDSDDSIEPDTLKKAIEAAEAHSCDIVCFDIRCIDEHGKEISTIECPHRNELLDREGALSALCGAAIRDYQWNKLYRAELFSDIRCPAGKTMEDVYTTYKVFLRAEKVYCLSQVLYNYRQRAGSILHVITADISCNTFASGYERYIEVGRVYPAAAEECFARLGMSALDLYNHSLWEQVDGQTLEVAVSFLGEHREKLEDASDSRDLRLYYSSPALYRLYRVLRHRIADVVKRIKHHR